MRYRLGPASVRPDGVIVNVTSLRTELMCKMLRSRQDGEWKAQHHRTLVPRWLRKLLGMRRSTEEETPLLFSANNVNDVIMRGNDFDTAHRVLTIDEIADATRILLELAFSAVPHPELSTPDDREVFFSRIQGFELPVSQLRVRWSEQAKVAVFYQANLASAFLPWARLHDYGLVHQLETFGDKFVVVAVAFAPMNQQLLQVFEKQRAEIWRRRDSRN